MLLYYILIYLVILNIINSNFNTLLVSYIEILYKIYYQPLDKNYPIYHLITEVDTVKNLKEILIAKNIYKSIEKNYHYLYSIYKKIYIFQNCYYKNSKIYL